MTFKRLFECQNCQPNDRFKRLYDVLKRNRSTFINNFMFFFLKKITQKTLLKGTCLQPDNESFKNNNSDPLFDP